MGIFTLALGLSACNSAPKKKVSKKRYSDSTFVQSGIKSKVPFVPPDMLKLIEANMNKDYLVGPGDLLKISVWNREGLSGQHLVGPFGKITLPILGEFKISDQTRDEAAASIEGKYQKYYENPKVTVKILKYQNNKVYVLGRVTNPGVIHFDGQATLLEALSLAGGLPTRDKSIFLAKCAIIRGNSQIIWVDLVQLLRQGNLKLNIKLQNNDVIHIPETTDSAVFVMGEVKTPGTFQIRLSGLSLLDAIQLAGGTTEDANLKEIRLIRNLRENNVRVVDLNNIIERGVFARNYELKDDDIIYVPRRGMAKFNYYLRQVDPLIRSFVGGSLLINTFSE